MTRFADPTFLILEARVAADSFLARQAALDTIWLRRSAKDLLDSIPRERSYARYARLSMQQPAPFPQTVVIAKDVARSQRYDAFRFLHFGDPLPVLEYDRDEFEASL